MISPTPISDKDYRAPTVIMLTIFGVILVTVIIAFLNAIGA